ncbi:MAG: RHS repeat-associated core domain-containing protein [Rhodobacteraceae bacterium]|nr:RHS repeat-associated core domain-containing protein [Paracoccaceae bacterium]
MHSDAVDEPVGFEEYTVSSGVGSGTEHALYADRQGSVIWVTEPATGQVVAGYEYDGYGQLTQTAGTLSQPYGYTGREYDAESGLYHYRARAYDPAAGVFVQSDPIEFAGQQLNLYSYVKNNPIRWADPAGLESAPYATAAAGAISQNAVSAISSGLLFGAVWNIYHALATSDLALPSIAKSEPSDDSEDREEECLKILLAAEATAALLRRACYAYAKTKAAQQNCYRMFNMRMEQIMKEYNQCRGLDE